MYLGMDHVILKCKYSFWSNDEHFNRFFDILDGGSGTPGRSGDMFPISGEASCQIVRFSLINIVVSAGRFDSSPSCLFICLLQF
jgi:hypothetical protein